MRKTLTLLISCLITTCVIAGTVTLAPKGGYGDFVIKDLVSVYDGDTFKINIPSVHPLLGKEINVRIWGVDTPEMTGKDSVQKQRAIAARNFLKNKLTQKTINLKNTQRDKYFRILADVYVGTENIKESIIKAGLGKPYNGGKKDTN